MTRTTLLHLLAHPAALSGADVRELEQLAQAFPYCQTAHVLLAKAAHDQGSMLASQRLRRAATYATDRARLRQLIELAPSPVVEPSAPDVELATVAEPAVAVAELAAATEEAPPLVEAPLPELPTEQDAPDDEPVVTLSEVEHTVLPMPELPSPEPEVLAETEAESEPEPELESEVAPVTEEAEAEPESESEEELPAQAPPIRPPAEAEIAHTEFGLAAQEPAEITAYTLPEVELPLGITIDVLSSPLPAYRGDPDVGYAPTEGSRLGFCLQGLTTEYSLTTGPAALLPSMAMPPASEFFAPDALVLAHLATHQPPAPAPAANDLIDSFLRRTPQGAARRRSLPAHPSSADEEQPDLSGPSTRVVPDLASENLAQILVRQGKVERAIAIYERLIVKHPEKMAYFAAQIDSLRPSA
ncbi:hypothetical protein FNT36_01470 [Hymenobacter setariae]|uniref:Tetratricopeptide repeat protein n=1 Tax=Hymenobacter setariae TaxID=2594794 RepID=A0A558C1U7_9BACT|nr:hypothetical protein [Hymenobacter setariae]TVT42791.1 hypothetical protein FNT36_01470 [Hymenobacter setariae]